MLPVRIQYDKIPSIIRNLAKHKAHTYKVVGALKLWLSGQRGGICHTDDWPDFTTVILKLTDPKMEVDTFHLFSTDQQKAHKLLTTHPELITSEGNFMLFGGIQRCLIDTIREVHQPRGFDVQARGPHYIMEADKLDSLPETPQLQEGYKTSTLSTKHTDFVKSFWFPHPNVEVYLNHVIQNHRTVSIETESGSLIGWIMENTYGCQGMLHVLEQHRRKGLGKYLMCKHRDLLLEDGLPVYSYFAVGNEASIKLAESCGYNNVNDDMGYGHYWVIANRQMIDN